MVPSPELHELIPHDAWMRRLARSLVQDPNQADDLVQRTWLEAVRNPPPRPSRNWLGRVLRNQARRSFRETVIRGDHESQVLAREPGESPLATTLRRDMGQSLVSAIQDLREPYRETIIAHHVHGLSSVEIAARDSVPEGTVRWRLKRGLELLREELDRSSGGDRERWIMGLVGLAGLDGDPRGGALHGTAAGSSVAFRVAAMVAFLAGGGWLVWSLAGSRPDPRAAEVVGLAQPARTENPLEQTRETSRDERLSAATEAVPAEVETPPDEPFSTVRVQALDPAGVPVEGAEVAILRGDDYVNVATTNDGGLATVNIDREEAGRAGSLVPSGLVGLRLFAAGMVSSPLISIDLEDQAPAAAQNKTQNLIGDGAGEPDLRIPMVAGTSVRGRVLSDGGQPLVGALVSIAPDLGRKVRAITDGRGRRAELAWSCLSTRSGDDGSFEVCGLPEVDCWIRVTAPGHEPLEVRHGIDAAPAGGIELTLGRGGSLFGTVRDTAGHPVPGARIWHDELTFRQGNAALNWPGYKPGLLGHVDFHGSEPDGSFEVGGMPVGRLRVWAQDPERPEWIASTIVDLRGQGRQSWEPLLAEGTPLELEVLGSDGELLEGVEVTFYQEEFPLWARTVRSGSDGRTPQVFDHPAGAVHAQLVLRGRAAATLRDIRAEDGLRQVRMKKLEDIPAINLTVRLRDHMGEALDAPTIRIIDGQGSPSPHMPTSYSRELAATVASLNFSLDTDELHVFAFTKASGILGLGSYDLSRERDLLIELRAPQPGLLVPVGMEGLDLEGVTYAVSMAWGVGDRQAFALVSSGQGAPPETLELLPGVGQLILRREGEVLLERRFRIHPGRETYVSSLGTTPGMVPIEVRGSDGSAVDDAEVVLYSEAGEVVFRDRGARRDEFGRWVAPLPSGSYEVVMTAGDGRMARRKFELDWGGGAVAGPELLAPELDPLVLTLGD